MNRVFLVVLCFLAYSIIVSAQGVTDSSKIDYFRLLELNVENLFDTAHDEGKDDLEFTPTGSRKWTLSRYRRKLRRTSKIIAAASDKQPLDLIALCEVENDSVMTHLTKRYPLRPIGYEYVMTNSEDIRGIDVALIYHPLRFRYLGHQSLRIPPPKRQRPTRDVLHTWGIVPTGDTLHVFVAHLPSKRGGIAETNAYRELVAQRIRQVSDSILRCNPHAKLIITGDFNDTPTSTTLRRGLGAIPIKSGHTWKSNELYLMSHCLKAAPGITGTYKYQGRWEQIDHIIVSGALFDPNENIYTQPDACQIMAFPFILKPDQGDGGVTPFRTFLGPRYMDGFTDHLPLLLTLQLNWPD